MNSSSSMGAPFSTMNATRTPLGWAVGRNQDFAAGKLGVEIGHFKRDMRNLPDEIGDCRVRFEAHPLHAKFAFLMADDEDLQMFQVGSPGLGFSLWEFRCDGSGAWFLALRWDWHKFYAVRGFPISKTRVIRICDGKARSGVDRC